MMLSVALLCLLTSLKSLIDWNEDWCLIGAVGDECISYSVLQFCSPPLQLVRVALPFYLANLMIDACCELLRLSVCVLLWLTTRLPTFSCFVDHQQIPHVPWMVINYEFNLDSKQIKWNFGGFDEKLYKTIKSKKIEIGWLFCHVLWLADEIIFNMWLANNIQPINP